MNCPRCGEASGAEVNYCRKCGSALMQHDPESTSVITRSLNQDAPIFPNVGKPVVPLPRADPQEVSSTETPFLDLPNPETIQHRAAAAQAQRVRFVKESETLFIELANRLRGLQPSDSFEVTKEQPRKPHWFFGARDPTPAVTQRGWDLGYIHGNADYPQKAYLLPDGSVYPNIESGVRAVLDRTPGYLWDDLARVEDPTLVARARSLVIEGLRQRYQVWCVGR
jgi:hypothetical protein